MASEQVKLFKIYADNEAFLSRMETEFPYFYALQARMEGATFPCIDV